MIRSDVFDDIYFSPDDGLAETRHVFLQGNGLPQGWSGRAHFTIAETGFGTGLNFLAAWDLFEKTAAPDAVLDYVSFELHPLTAAQIREALTPWAAELGGRMERFLASYPLRIPGWHRIDLGRVRLTLVFDDVNAALPRLVAPLGVDAWFLDGFAPAKNPQMWTQTLFAQMARLSHEGTSAATFTAAGFVRRGLADAGFAVEKKRGYGRKRDMTAARYQGQAARLPAPRPRRIAIVGGGLAGTSCAHVLGMRGYNPVLFEAAPVLASGASGNPRGIYNPRLSAQRSAEADFYMSGFALAARSLPAVKCGSLHLMADDDKRKRFYACRENWGWHPDHMQILSAADSSALAGVRIAQESLYLPDSGYAVPPDICRQWGEGAEIRCSSPVAAEILQGFDAVVLACGVDVRDFVPWLPVHTVRGQVVRVPQTPVSAALKTNICFGGYISPAVNGEHIAGSTFQKWISTTEIREEDTRAIIERVAQAVPDLSFDVQRCAGARAALRCSSQDRFPVIGAVPGLPGFYVSAAHGSHGLVSALAGAHLLADMVDESVFSLPLETVNLLSPQRFPERAARRGQSVI